MKKLVSKTPTIKLSTGALIPAIGFGTWQLDEGREVKGAISEALKTGYRLIDTARIYRNEKGVGETIHESGIAREDIFVTTKLWPGDFGAEKAKDAFEGSMERLGLEYIDLYLIHWPAHNSEVRRQSWQALTELYNEGQVKTVGVSNYEVHHLEEIMTDSALVPAVNQIQFHPFIYEDQKETLEFCKQNGIIVEAYSPLAMGRQVSHPVISRIAEKNKRTNAQVMLRWAIQHDTVPLPRSRNPEHIRSNFEVFDFELADEDMNKLDELSR